MRGEKERERGERRREGRGERRGRRKRELDGGREGKRESGVIESSSIPQAYSTTERLYSTVMETAMQD